MGGVSEFNIYLGNWSKAVEVADELLSVIPDNPFVFQYRTLATGFLGEWENCISIFEKERITNSDSPNLLLMLGIAYGRTAQPEKTKEIISQLLRLESMQEGLLLDQIGVLYGTLLLKDEFFSRLETSITRRSAGMIWYYNTCILPEEINRDERFRQIRRKLELPV